EWQKGADAPQKVFLISLPPVLSPFFNSTSLHRQLRQHNFVNGIVFWLSQVYGTVQLLDSNTGRVDLQPRAASARRTFKKYVKHLTHICFQNTIAIVFKSHFKLVVHSV